MHTNTFWMFTLLSTLVCTLPLQAVAHDTSSREGRTRMSLSQERQELARQEAQLAQDSLALEERRAELAKRRAALLEREREVMAQNSSTRRNQRDLNQSTEQSLTNLGARESERGFVLTLSDIQFKRDESELSAETMRKLYPLSTILKNDPQRSIMIEGYTDSSGDEKYNQELSEQRASAVRDFLVSTGIDPRRITIRGYGEEYPIASNDTESGRRENRRVEVIVTRETERTTKR